jgi:putative flippase GtrA
LDDYLTLFWAEKRGALKPWYLAQKKATDIIISASPEFLLNQIVCKELHLCLLASPVDANTGKFTGKNCRGEEKIHRLDAAFPGLQIGEFYSDSLSDAPLAARAKHAFFVEGRKRTPWAEYKLPLLKRLKKIYLAKSFLLFVLCGGAGTFVNFVCSVLISFVFVFEYGATLAYVFGYALSMLATYALNAKLIFHRKPSAADFAKFTISYIPNFLLLLTFVAIFLNFMHWHKIAVYAMAGALGIPVTWLLVKCFAFGKQEKKHS